MSKFKTLANKLGVETATSAEHKKAQANLNALNRKLGELETDLAHEKREGKSRTRTAQKIADTKSEISKIKSMLQKQARERASDMTLAEAKEKLAAAGMVISHKAGVLCVYPKGGNEDDGYFTKSLTDAVEKGLKMKKGEAASAKGRFSKLAQTLGVETAAKSSPDVTSLQDDIKRVTDSIKKRKQEHRTAQRDLQAMEKNLSSLKKKLAKAKSKSKAERVSKRAGTSLPKRKK